MGIVYEAFDEQRRERVALKTIRVVTADSLARFKREFRTVADVRHPNLVRLGDLISEGDHWFFTMELVEGDDFVTYVRDGPRRPPGRDGDPASPAGFDEGRLRPALAQLARGLAALHEAGIVHRDVKPSNVRVTAAGRVVVFDFGLVAELQPNRIESSARMEGTPAYMAPEQATSSVIGAEADWYSVGVVLFQALTGALPFDGASPLDIMMNKQRREPPTPRAIAPDLPSDLVELCVGLLRFEPRARPGAAQILRVLGGLDAKPTHPGSFTQPPPFLGRAPELAALREAFDVTREGRDAAVVIEGESGVGKSCLARGFAEALAAERPDLLVLAGRCYEREAVPFKAFDAAVDALARFLSRAPADVAARVRPTRIAPLAQVFPVLCRVEAFAQATRGAIPPIDPLELRSRAFAAFREMFTRLVDLRPVILILDDLQWADVDSLALLAELMRPPDAPALLLIATTRPPLAAGDSGSDADDGGVLRSLSAVRDLRTIRLGALSRSDAERLASSLLARIAPGAAADASSIAREAAGHPLFIETLAHHAAIVGPGPNAGKLEEALWWRVAGLEPKTRLLMETIAMAGGPVSHEVLAYAAGEEPGDLFPRVQLLRVAHLVNAGGGRLDDALEPYHDQVRSAVLAHLDPATRSERHRTLAVALERARSDDTEALARHWIGAGELAEGAKYAALAADQASRSLAFDRAAALYGMALTHAEHPPDQLRVLQERRGDALASAGRGILAAEAYRIAAGGAPAADALDLRRRAAEQLLRAGHFDMGVEALREVLASIGAALPRTPLTALLSYLVRRVWLRIRGLGYTRRDVGEIAAHELARIDVYWSVAVGLSLVDTIRAQACQARGLLLALRAGEPYRVARALAIEVSFLASEGGGSWDRAERVMSSATRLSDELDRPHAKAFALVTSTIAFYLNGKFKRALSAAERAVEILQNECAGVVWEIDTAQSFAIWSLAQLGRLKELRLRQTRYLREALARGDLYGSVLLRGGDAVLGWLAADEPDEASRQVDDAMNSWSKKGFHLEHFYEMISRTHVHLYASEPALAREHVTRRWPALGRSLLRRVQLVRIQSRKCRARVAIALAEAQGAEDRVALLREAERDAGAIERERMPWATPHARLLRAGIAVVRGGHERAAVLLRESIVGFEAADLEIYAACARRSLGMVLGGGEGAAMVREADDVMVREGVVSPGRMSAMLAPGFARFAAPS